MGIPKPTDRDEPPIQTPPLEASFLTPPDTQSIVRGVTGHETDAMFNRYDITDNDDNLAALEAARKFAEQQPGEKAGPRGYAAITSLAPGPPNPGVALDRPTAARQETVKPLGGLKS